MQMTASFPSSTSSAPLTHRRRRSCAKQPHPACCVPDLSSSSGRHHAACLFGSQQQQQQPGCARPPNVVVAGQRVRCRASSSSSARTSVQLPLFPLEDVVVLPGHTLPLVILEARSDMDESPSFTPCLAIHCTHTYTACTHTLACMLLHM